MNCTVWWFLVYKIWRLWTLRGASQSKTSYWFDLTFYFWTWNAPPNNHENKNSHKPRKQYSFSHVLHDQRTCFIIKKRIQNILTQNKTFNRKAWYTVSTNTTTTATQSAKNNCKNNKAAMYFYFKLWLLASLHYTFIEYMIHWGSSDIKH